MASPSLGKCIECNTVATSTHRLMQCGRCKNVAYCNTACQRAHWPTHKLVCRKDDGPSRNFTTFLDETPIDAPSPWVSRQMVGMLGLEPAVMEELAELTAADRVFIERSAARGMSNGVDDEVIRQIIVEGLGAVKQAKRAVEREREVEQEVEQEAEGESEGEVDEGDEADGEVVEGLWQRIRKVLAQVFVCLR